MQDAINIKQSVWAYRDHACYRRRFMASGLTKLCVLLIKALARESKLTKAHVIKLCIIPSLYLLEHYLAGKQLGIQ